MARMYSRKKGKSGSTRPIKKSKPSWLRYKPKEIEMLIGKLAKEGKTSSQIGIVLRDVYGVPDVKVVCEKSISQIMEEKKLTKNIPEDLTFLLRRLMLIKKHLDENKKDMPAKRGLQLTQSKIGRLVKYYKKKGKLAQDWTYDIDNISLLIE